MALTVYLAFTAASVIALIAFAVRLINDMPVWRSFICLAPVIGLVAHLFFMALGYDTLALWGLALASVVVFGGSIVYAVTDVPLDEVLFPQKKQSDAAAPTKAVMQTKPVGAEPEIRPTKHPHLRIVR